jgi:predicted transcriptional regulator
MRRRIAAKPATQMNTKELGQATKEFEREFVADAFGPPGPVERQQWRRAKRKRGRPRRGRGVKVISVSLEKGLLSRCDALAKRLGVSRAALISRGIHEVLSAAPGR